MNTSVRDVSAALITQLHALALEAGPAYERDLSEVVALDSGSYDPAGVNRVADWVSARLASDGFAVERVASPDGQTGDAVIGRRRGTGTKRIALFAHMDTVFEAGDATRRPFRVDERGYGRGPGVTDDKAGVIASLHAAAHLRAAGAERFGELILIFTPDEEIGSPFGASVLRDATAGIDVALCMECARENGDLVTSRKGVADLEIAVKGKAAHSGIEPERGAHAGLEAAHLTLFLQGLADPVTGVTVNVGMLRAGERLNIVPDRAVLHVEVRAITAVALDSTLDKIRERLEAPVTGGTELTLAAIDHCPPMEETAAGSALAQRALAIARELGFTPGLARTGGVSDSNRIAARGIVTLDGLGPVGGGDHSENEWLDLASVPDRVSLLAALIDDIGGSD
ncbi:MULTISPECIES: M20/M25/M40 family metallo-hydrolase [Leucobacter]|uniref:M20/M25/M40 family metallo-hydrolase n=1 Tax=Leucobacter TaxID=55968 RepID=UPI002106D04D|nr:M20/M25/M40 family metallo-hydrolase [Leucobacter aridicollis]UTX53564.1 M20/M25/M40 family metallo-hydrolase [Leucobacter aridicollis]